MSTALISFDVTLTYTSLSPAGSGLQPPTLGQVYEDGKGNKYRFVQNKEASTAFVIGDAVCYSYANNLTAEVKVPVTGTLSSIAGIACGAIPAAGYGWIQYMGYNATVNVTGHASSAAGDSMKGANASASLVRDAAQGTAPAFVNTVILLAAYTTVSAATKAAIIACPQFVGA